MSIKSKKIQRVDIKDRKLSQYLTRLADSTDKINTIPFNNGFQTTVEITLGSTFSIKHGMGQITGWFPLSIKSLQFYNIFEFETDNDNTLTFDTSAVTESFSLTIWIF